GVVVAFDVDHQALQHLLHVAGHFGLDGLELAGIDEVGDVVVGVEALAGGDQALPDPFGGACGFLGHGGLDSVDCRAHQGRAWPRWSKKPTDWAGCRVSSKATSRRAASAGERTSSPALPKGADSRVSTVPGCSATQTASGQRLRSSIEAVRTSWFSAAFEARYEYQPPSRLSP